MTPTLEDLALVVAGAADALGCRQCIDAGEASTRAHLDRQLREQAIVAREAHTGTLARRDALLKLAAYALLSMQLDNDPVWTAILAAPIDPTPETPEELAAIAEARCRRCGSTLSSVGHCSRREHGCQGGRGELDGGP